MPPNCEPPHKTELNRLPHTTWHVFDPRPEDTDAEPKYEYLGGGPSLGAERMAIARPPSKARHNKHIQGTNVPFGGCETSD